MEKSVQCSIESDEFMEEEIVEDIIKEGAMSWGRVGAWQQLCYSTVLWSTIEIESDFEYW